MFIKRIEIVNYKSFKDFKIELDKFNVLIGANASGKSNFIQLFAFIRNIINYGLDNAISLQGGIEYLKNINLSKSDNFSVKIILEPQYGFGHKTTEGIIGIKIYETIYEFTLRSSRGKLKYAIVEDKLTNKCDFMKLRQTDKGKIEEKGKIGTGEIVYSIKDGKIDISFDKPDTINIKIDNIHPPFIREEKIDHNTLLIENLLYFFPILDDLSEISIYDFDPKIPKKGTPITGKAELEEDGSNLSIVLKKIIEDKNKKRKLFNLVSDVLPFIGDLNVEKFSDKSLLFKLKEVYSKKEYLPASLISDGTINITALIIAIFFEKKPITIIEEPERNIHPYLISRLIEMMKEASKNKQIIITTHNPEIVKYAGLENILLISRDKEGFSKIIRPVDKEEVKIFLKNEIGIEELYVQNLLG